MNQNGALRRRERCVRVIRTASYSQQNGVIRFPEAARRVSLRRELHK